MSKHHWTSGIKLGHWDQCWQAIWNSWEFQTGKERENAAKSYSCLCLARSNSLPLPFRTPATQASLCPASDQASGLIHTETTKAKYHKGKENPAPKKRKIKCHKIAKHVCTSLIFRVITNEKKAWNRASIPFMGIRNHLFWEQSFLRSDLILGPALLISL